MRLRREPRRGQSAEERAPSGSRRGPLIVAVGLAATAVWTACATAEPPAFSDGTCVAAGCVQTSSATTGSSSSSGMCVVDPGCTVSWGTDVFSKILDGPAGCTQTGLCHGSGSGGLTLASGQAHDAYTALGGYTLTLASGMEKYIVPCDPMGSGFPCNMALAADAGANPYGSCSIAMPFGTTAAPLTTAELTTIASWIQCGAPEN